MKYIVTTTQILALAVSMCSIAEAASSDDYAMCSLVYGALFQAAKDAQHDGMLSYSKPRLQAVLPYIQENKDNQEIKEKFRETSLSLRNEIKNTFLPQATVAIREEDPVKLKSAISRVFQCDKVFGLHTLPLPFAPKSAPRLNEYMKGFHEGCLAKQRKVASPFSNAQIKGYCQCMTDKAARMGIDSNSADETVGKAIRESHGGCFASIQ